MSILQDEVPPQDFATIQAIVESELDFEKTFATFEPTPIGSASIGQVHRATLRDGTHVVVKVCYPKVEELLTGDVRTIKMFAQVAQPVHVPALEEIEKQFQTEFDYRKEAEQLQFVRDNLIKAGLAGPDKLCIVPKPYMKYCTKRVLVMEELYGEKLVTGLKKDIQAYAARAGQSMQEFLDVQKEKELEYAQRGERMQGATESEYNVFIRLEDSKRMIQNGWNRLYNLTTALTTGAPARSYKDKSDLPINHAKLVDDLLYIHGHEVLVDGRFNGDCHPGNILMCRKSDGSPLLGLIDYGQTKTLSKEKRHLFCNIIIALDNNNREEVVRLMKEAGFKVRRKSAAVMIC
jgi:aarF domain-containing kinase